MDLKESGSERIQLPAEKWLLPLIFPYSSASAGGSSIPVAGTEIQGFIPYLP